jgi:ABC-type transport system substrate-binding protein
MNKKKILIALFLTMVMMGSAYAVLGNMTSATGNTNSTNFLRENGNGLNSNPLTQTQAKSSAWKYPINNVTNEPHYTGGVFKIGQIGNAGSMNPFQETTYCDAYVDCQIWGQTALYETLPNGTSVPWMASGLTVQHVGSGNKTYDIATNSYQSYSYVYTVHIRPYVRWTDWSPSNATQTYVFSNHTEFCYNGKLVSHTYKTYTPTVMKKYYLQSADVVLNYRIKSYLGDFPNVVNVVPDGNLSVKFFVTRQTLLLYTDILACDILPYNIWVKHDYTTSGAGLFNYTNTSSTAPFHSTASPGQGYCGWNLGWNPTTGSAPGMVGAGAFMVANSFGMPQGQVIPGEHETLYVNPYYFTQYTNASSGLRQFTPKIYEIYMPIYDSVSSEISAFEKGQIDTTSLAPSPNFLPQLSSTPNSFIYKKLSSAYGYWELNTAVAPLNITAFRQALSYAVPYTYINQVILDGLGYPSSSGINPGNTLYYNASAPQYTLNMAKAKSLIQGIPGMKYSSTGQLMYQGKQVTLTVQITTGAENPTGVAAIEKTFQYWNALGVKTVLKQEAFTTLQSNVDTTILSHHKSNLFEIASEGESTSLSDPILDCQAHLSPVVGIPDKSYLGPFSSMEVNGKMLSGNQVQQLYCSLINKSINTDSFTVASQVAKRIDSLIIEQDPVISTGYATDLIPLSHAFSNYSTTYSAATYLYWFWEYSAIYKNTSVVNVVHKYKLSISESTATGNVYNGKEYGNITFTVMNGTSPAKNVEIFVGDSSTYGGLVNVTSNEIKTNQQGQAVWEFKTVSYLSSLFTGTNATTGATYYVHNETMQVIASASQPHATETASGSVNISFDIINAPILKSTYFLKNTVYNTTEIHGTQYLEKGQLVFSVTYNGTPYSGATVILSKSSIVSALNISSFSATTNSAGQAVFNFSVTSKDLSSAQLVGDLKNTTITAQIYSNSKKINNFTMQPSLSLARAAVTSSASSAYVDIIIGGIVGAVVVVGVASYVLFFRKKIKKQ